MGREIRRVPANWEHPKNEYGNLKPLYDQEYRVVANEWVDGFLLWLQGTHKDSEKHSLNNPYYWEWVGNPPDEEYYRPAFEEEATHFQIYETVSEGTPTSPIFANRQHLVAWLVKEGYTRKAAVMFARKGYVPTGLIVPGKGIIMGIETARVDW